MTLARQLVCILMGAILSWFGYARSAAAYPVHRRMFQAQYGKATRCDLCHADGAGGERNAYGKDWAKAGQSPSSFTIIDKLDSDGDGFANGEEIARDSNPGDARSSPERPDKTFAKAQTIPIPTDQLTLLFGNVDAFEASEPNLDADDVKRIEQAARTKLSPEDLMPTLYFGVRGGVRTGVALFRHYDVSGARFSLLLGTDQSARVIKSLMFRAGNDESVAYASYLECIRSHGVSDLPDPGTGKCPISDRYAAGARATARAIRTGLWTVRVLLEEATAGAPPNDPVPGNIGSADRLRSHDSPSAASSAETAAGGNAPGRGEERAAVLNLSLAKTASQTSAVSRAVVLGAIFACILAWLGLIAATVRFAQVQSPGGVSLPR